MTNTEYFPCGSKNPSPDLSGLCEALQASEPVHWFERSTYRTKYCHSPMDDYAPLISREFPQNPNIVFFPPTDKWKEIEELTGKTADHLLSSALCQFLALLEISSKLN